MVEVLNPVANQRRPSLAEFVCFVMTEVTILLTCPSSGSAAVKPASKDEESATVKKCGLNLRLLQHFE